MKKYFMKSFPYSLKKFLYLSFSIMVVSAISGFILEQICGWFINDGKSHHGTSFGPWIQIYGFGMLVVFLLFWGLHKKPWLAIPLGALTVAGIEFVTALIMDKCMNWREWDYSDGLFSIGSINGYVALIPTLGFAIGITVVFYVLVPLFNKLESLVGLNVVFTVSFILAALFLLDVLYNDILSPLFGWYSAYDFYGRIRTNPFI